jgi:hypothetical protein
MESIDFDGSDARDQSYKEAFSTAVLRAEQLAAVTESTAISHVTQFGEQPLTGISIIDALKYMGPCPCVQCFRDEFIS